MTTAQTVVVLTVYVLAVARVTRLINADTLTDPIRLFVARRSRPLPQIPPNRSPAEQKRWATVGYFLSCPWCVGFWLALGTAIFPVLIAGWPWWALFPVALAASHIVGVTARWANDEDIEIEDVTAHDV